MRRNPEDLIEDIRSYMAANFFNEPLTGILEEAANTIEILMYEKSEEDEDDIITNGEVIEDMLEELFESDEDLDFVAVAKGCVDGTMEIRISKDWWNAAHKTGTWGYAKGGCRCEEDKRVAYICDQNMDVCRGGEPGCKNGGECQYATDPAHAKNFEAYDGTFWEKAEEDIDE